MRRAARITYRVARAGLALAGLIAIAHGMHFLDWTFMPASSIIGPAGFVIPVIHLHIFIHWPGRP